MKKIIKNIFIILSPSEKKGIVRLIILDVLVSLLDIAFLALLLVLIQYYTQPGEGLLQAYVPATLLDHDPLLPIVVFFFLFSIKNFFGFRVFRMQLNFTYGVASRLSQKNIMDYLNGTYGDYVNIDSSVHIRKISQQPVEFCHYVLGGFQQVISQFILILITITAVLVYNPVLFPVLFIILTPPLIFTGYLMKRRLHAIRKTAKPVSEKTIQYLKEALSGFIEANLYNAKPFFSNRYHVFQSKFNHFLSEQQVVQNMPSRLMEIFAILGLGVLIILNSYTSHTHSLQIITLGAFMAAAYKIIPGVVKILNSSGQMKTYEFTVNDLLLDAGAPVLKNDLPTSALRSFSFERVCFGFKNGPVLKEVSFSVSRGDFVGLSAVSGKGKTTLVNLLLGFLESEAGAIRLNGVRMTAEERQRFWKRISYVTQQPLLICDTILKNVVLEESHFDFQRLEEVVRITGLKELVANYPEGFNKIISENGRNLSGGQRQRMTIARALYRQADLIILDEPFSELDRDSENELLRFFGDLALEGKIILLITHNRESLSFCNKIISLDEKRTALFGDIDPRFS